MDATLALPVLVFLIAVALLFDFLNGLARRRQFDRDDRVDPGAAAAICGDLGGVLQFHRLPVVRAPRRQYDRHRHHRAERRRCRRDLCGAGGRHRLEPDHLGARDSLVEFARADRRAGRRRHGEGRDFGGGLERPFQDAAGDRAVAAGRVPAGAGAGRDRVLAVGALDAVCGRSRVPHPAIRLGVALFARPWRQRRAEDHGHHRGAARIRRAISARTSTSRSGW